jgi:hypothetical protein
VISIRRVTPTRNVSERDERTLVEKLNQLIQTINNGDDVDEKRVDDDATDDDDDDDDEKDDDDVLCATTGEPANTGMGTTERNVV